MDGDANHLYQSLIEAEPPWDRPAADALDHIGRLIDVSYDLGRADGARRALELAARLRDRGPLSEVQEAELLYYEANAWAARRPFLTPGNADAWNWNDEALDNEIRLLRRALRAPGYAGLAPLRRSQILTNLGNALDTLGRFVEAIELYEGACDLDPENGMARGNLGICLANHGGMLLGLPHPTGGCAGPAFVLRAWAQLGSSLNMPLDPQSAAAFAAWFQRLQPLVEGMAGHPMPAAGEEELGATEEERRYREWSLANRLFLNPLNDLDVDAAAASDPIHLPPLVDQSDHGLYFHGLLNQIKQDYATARLFLYEGLIAGSEHFADRGVALINTLDYSVYSIHLEKVRIAFRMAYALFDKIGVFLNAYLALGIEPWKVHFRRLWYRGEQQKNALKRCFERKENWPLRGLFGLSRDLSASADDRETLDPDARDLVEIRTHLEHRHLTIHEERWIASGRGRAGESPDGLSFAVDRADFEARAVRIVKLARSAIVYLVHAVWFEEMARASSRGDAEVVIPLALGMIEDGWKR